VTDILPQSNAQGEGIDEKLCQRLTSKNYPAEAPEGDSKENHSQCAMQVIQLDQLKA
jgi:hypothetical protein